MKSSDDSVEGSEENEKRAFHTGNYCFICLSFVTPRHDKAIASDWDNPNSSSSLLALLRYLNLGDKNARPELCGGGETYVVSFISGGPDTTALLCELCSKINYKVGGLVQAIQLAQMEMNHYLDIIHKKIKYSGKIPDDVEIGKSTKNPKLDVENMREAILNKCVRLTYKCEVCQKIFGTRHRLERHRVEVHQNGKVYQCGSCDMKFPLRQKLYQHRNKVHLQIRHRCKAPGCPSVYKNKRDLDHHLKTIHPDFKEDVTPVALPESKGRRKDRCRKNLPCDICGNIFYNNYVLKCHKKKVHDAAQLICKHCNRSFPIHSKAFSSHVEDCANKPKKFSCNVCQLKFGGRTSLRSHKLTVHVRSQQYKCNQCDRIFYRSSYLTAHQRSVHTWPEIRFNCTVPGCEKTYKVKHALKAHLLTVHNTVMIPKTRKTPKNGKNGEGHLEQIAEATKTQLRTNVKCEAPEKPMESEDFPIIIGSVISIPCKSEKDNVGGTLQDTDRNIKQCEIKKEAPTLISGSAKMHKCDICLKTFRNKGALTSHCRHVHKPREK